ncbi:Bifunctional purine biosynthesis protein PurH [Coemansia sp. S142-1]|nr:Bifunctional purine biosynthesis protein PurH [Coemansia sp. S17]KAJ2098106.1 Bifunctional purine biosynthesis protein PurH [Coemansia sp. S142-1]
MSVLSSSFAAALSALNFGWCLGEPNIPEDIIKECVEGPETYINGLPTCLPMSSTMWGLVVGLVALGALVGSLSAGRAADRFGRKNVLLANNVFYVTGALLLGTSTTVAQLAVGRFVSGIGCGVSSTVVATYNSECAPVKARGLLGTMLQLAVELGIFFSQLIATFLVQVPNWRILFGLSGAISLIQLVWLPFMPESPKFLLTQGRTAEAGSALQFLRPGYNITNELQEMIASSGTRDGNAFPVIGQTDEAGFAPDNASELKVTIEGKPNRASFHSASGANIGSIGLIDIIKGRTPDIIWHTLFCTLFLMGFQQWTGAKGIVFYSTEILVNVLSLSPSQVRQTPNSAQWVTIGLAGTGILAVLASMNLIDRLGRRRLLLISTGGVSIACFIIVIGRVYHASVLAVVAMFAFKIAYGLGMAPIPWLTASEMLPYYALGTMSGIASALNWTMIFTIGLLFPVLARVLRSYLFLPFAMLNLAGFVVVLLVVPETKGRHISDILFHHGRRVHVVFSPTAWIRRRRQIGNPAVATVAENLA